MAKFSIIFPTYQRSHDLKIALDSLLEQTLLPHETIVIDQSDDDEAKKLCAQKRYQKINLRYFRSDCKSPPKAKQIGMKKLSPDSEVMIFFDDDVKIDPSYLREVDNFLKKKPKALGGGGFIHNLPHKKSLLENIGYKLFRTPKISHEFCTTDAQYKNPNQVQTVLTIIGCNMFFRSNLSQNFNFVDRMKKYGHADDTFFSYQISHAHPDSLFYLPTAKLRHFESPAGRIAKTEKFKQILLHRFVFRKKYKFPMRTFYRRSLGFLTRFLLGIKNKAQILKFFFLTHARILRHSEKIQHNPATVNKFIYERKSG